MGNSVDRPPPSFAQKAQTPGVAATTQQGSAHDASGSQPREPIFSLQLLFSGRAGVVLEAPRILIAGSTAIGRALADPDISLTDDERISRTHAMVLIRDGSAQLVDNKSRNGTFVNGTQTAQATLQDGDLIRVGNSFLLFRRVQVLANEPSATVRPNLGTTALLGQSRAMRVLRHTIEQVAPTESFVLLLGESGTGKELAAEALHRLSTRAQEPFIAVNCATIPETLAESLLFGHEKGSFTGAERRQDGYFRAAHRGTLFLDEVAELPRLVQPKLLRAIEKRQITPVGSTKQLDIDVRIIAATNRNLVDDINFDDFRGDLFFRLADLIVQLPRLCERREDVLPLLLSTWSKNPPRLAPELVEALLLHPWPFNVRELLKIGKELQIKGQAYKELSLELVADRLALHGRLNGGRDAPPPDIKTRLPPGAESLIPSRDELLELLHENKGNISAIARVKERTRTQVHRWLEARGIQVQRTK